MVKLKFIIFSADNINIKNIVLPVITLKSNIIYFRIFHMNFEYGFNFYLCIIVVFIVHFNIEIWERIKFFEELITTQAIFSLFIVSFQVVQNL